MCSWFLLRTTLESYTLTKWWKFEQFRLIWSFLKSMRRVTLLSWAFVGIWIEPSLLNTHVLLVWLDDHIGVIIAWEDEKSSSDFGLSWSFSKFMLRRTLLNWASVGVIDYVESSHHPYAIGLTWEPHQSRMLVRENDRSSSDFGPFWSFLKFILRTTLLSWASVAVVDWNRVLPTPLSLIHISEPTRPY